MWLCVVMPQQMTSLMWWKETGTDWVVSEFAFEALKWKHHWIMNLKGISCNSSCAVISNNSLAFFSCKMKGWSWLLTAFFVLRYDRDDQIACFSYLVWTRLSPKLCVTWWLKRVGSQSAFLELIHLRNPVGCSAALRAHRTISVFSKGVELKPCSVKHDCYWDLKLYNNWNYCLNYSWHLNIIFSSCFPVHFFLFVS